MSTTSTEFFLIIPPGFERVAAGELRRTLGSAEIIEQTRGGIAFKSELNEGLELNRVLKVPARILVRLADFGCSDFPKLFKKTKSFPWAEWLPKNSKVRVEASSHQSRLKIKSRIEATVLDALSKNGFIVSDHDDDEGVFAIYIRFNEDVCYMSLDSSGEILHKRGYREYTPEAPIRENLASAILLTAKERFDDVFGEQLVTILDPMAGSGTFLLEAFSLFHQSNREFSFQKFSNYVPTSKTISNKNWLSEAFGIESDTKSIAAAKKAFGTQKQKFTIEQMDVFGEPSKATAERIALIKKSTNKILVCNPPYGKRLKIDEPFSTYYPKILNRFEELFSPQIASVILPQKVNLERLKIPPQWEIMRTDQFSNGGFSVVLVTFKRSG